MEREGDDLMRVRWCDLVDGYENESLPIAIHHAGEVITAVRTVGGETRLVVMCDDDEVRDVKISRVRRDDSKASHS